MKYIIIMNKFNIRLNELMEENKITANTIAIYLNLANTSVVYKWKNGHKGILLDTAIKLADIFNCSLDYLFGRSENYGNRVYKKIPQFGEQLKTVLSEQNISQNKLIKYANVNAHSLNNWLNDKSKPNMDSVIKIADYLDVTIDYLVGR